MSDPEIVDRMGGGKKLPTLKSCCYVRKPLHHPPVQSLNDFWAAARVSNAIHVLASVVKSSSANSLTLSERITQYKNGKSARVVQ